ncbi:MAG: pentapeptide repeat-containing protein [Clostridiales bacterium]|nr:pentapeptide repeat-containing protein [Clostridiales bacterium]
MKKKKKKNNQILILWGVFFTYVGVTIMCTFLYNTLRLPNIQGILGRDSFYESFVEGMYSSIADFFVFTIVVSILFSKWEKNNALKRCIEEIDACRFWNSDQAAYRLRAMVSTLQEDNIFTINLSKCYMGNIKLKKLQLVNSDMMGAIFSKSNFESSEFRECNLKGSFLEKAIFRKSKFIDCKLQFLKCKDGNMRSCFFERCDLKGSDFTNLDLRYTLMRNCNLEKVNFTDCNLERANLLGSYNISIEELIKSKSLKYIKIDETIKQDIELRYPTVVLK